MCPRLSGLNLLKRRTPASRSYLPKPCWTRRHFRRLWGESTDDRPEAVEFMCDATALSQRRACRLTGLSCRPVAMRLSVRQLMRIYQGASLSWHWSAGALATAASGSWLLRREGPSLQSQEDAPNLTSPMNFVMNCRSWCLTITTAFGIEDLQVMHILDFTTLFRGLPATIKTNSLHDMAISILAWS